MGTGNERRPDDAGGRIVVATGARAAEAHLLERVRAHVDAVRADPRLLATPFGIVVPSRSLRLHVAGRIASELGAVAGVEVQTLFGAAVRILERAGEPILGGDALVDVLVRRHAAEERSLRDAFAAFTDGFRVVCATVRDLFDAGFEVELAEPLLELLAGTDLGHATRERAAAVVRTAARVATDLAERGLGGRSELLRRARVAYREDPGRLPARPLVVHGFADATGCATDLIEALVQFGAAHVLLDRPPDPEDLARPDLGWAFVDRLRERLEGHVASAPVDVAPRPVQPELVRAPGALAEVQAVAARIRRALDDGVCPERIGVVARDLSAYRVPLRARFAALGIPSSALRTRAPIDGAGRRLAALATLCEEGGQTPTDRWLDGVAALERPDPDDPEGTVRRAPSAELRLGLRVLGAARVDDVAKLEPERHLESDEHDEHGVLKLPVRSGIRVFDPDTDDERELRRSARYVAPRLRLSGAELTAAVRAARATLRRLDKWRDGRAPVRRHVTELVTLARTNAGWRAGQRPLARLRQALEPLQEIGAEELGYDELLRIVRPLLLRAAEPAFAGQGGGVRVLDAMEARGLTFERLFVLGLNRDVFPRVGSEDALIPDDGRRVLAGLLPDLPLHARRRLEDRYLFAQLVSAGEAVTLSWQSTADDGKPAVVSPLVERLFGERSEDDCVETAPPFWSDAAFDRTLRPARESAVAEAVGHAAADSAIDSTGGRFRAAVTRALADRGRDGADELAAVRARVLAAFERGPREPERLAPWLGFLGRQAEGLARPDPRREALFVTQFEGLVRCPWQAMLQKVLRIEEAPDPLDALPGIEPRILGNAVHGALEVLVRRATSDAELTLREAVAREPQPVTWIAGDVDELLRAATHAALEREREPAPGLVQAYVACARPLFDTLVQWLDAEQRRWKSGALGAEVIGQAPVPGSELAVAFRADVVEARPGDNDGERVVVLSDYKTGAAKRAKDYRDKGIRTGKQLQPIAYALGAADLGFDARGRFLFASADELDDVPVGLGADWRELVGEWTNAILTVADAWVAGEFFPRVLEPHKNKEPDACGYCAYAPACLQGDSGAKRATLELATSAEHPAARALWHLPDPKSDVRRGGSS